MSSPPPPYNFAVIPVVASRHPLWEDRLTESAERSSLDEGLLLDRGRETVATSPLDGEPDLILEMPTDSIAPFLLALGLSVLFGGALFNAWPLAGFGGLVVCGGRSDRLVLAPPGSQPTCPRRRRPDG